MAEEFKAKAAAANSSTSKDTPKSRW